jgi:hypothetical protein
MNKIANLFIQYYNEYLEKYLVIRKIFMIYLQSSHYNSLINLTN